MPDGTPLPGDTPGNLYYLHLPGGHAGRQWVVKMGRVSRTGQVMAMLLAGLRVVMWIVAPGRCGMPPRQAEAA